ncbi:sigma-54-dependent Fis family transcriptional regulator [Shewanella sp. 202IG2-18]|uniref:sigma-54-dependent transcriptional regulator n=1 Tax=Parashewanella hymeniacidonis TaxID=2807618 RepID=UPI001961F20A|nr:sigma-54 dependent transcriptional regulator [Parashewanella hymeniacidonis]MBM7072216.1 sigma-54-dependent Fis family transcriptional regulator [Parashewanella hymeniacidonis]
MSQAKILLVEDDASLREALVDTLLIAQYECLDVSCGEDAIIALKSQTFDMIISDVQMDGIGGIGLLNYVSVHYQHVPVLMMTAYATVNAAVEAIKLGAVDYLSKPFATEVLLNQVSRYLPNKIDVEKPIAEDEKSINLFSLAKRVAKSEASVMIMGPSGSGKEVMARYIHQNSARKEQPFVAINCAAIPENMLEATLFGYEKGAFTGAHQACPGKFEQAQGGTLLLDEISEMEIGLQAKLLRVLQEREVERLGGRKTIELDVRVLATSNRDLKAMAESGKFREDLYYRINVFPLTWPALYQRPADIIPLAKHLIGRHSQKQGLMVTPELDELACRKLLMHRWPGNVRELDNVVQRALILHQGEQIVVDDVIIDVNEVPGSAYIEQPDNSSTTADSLGNELQSQEHMIILETLNQCNGSRKEVADKLGISPRTLRYKMAKMRDAGLNIPG